STTQMLAAICSLIMIAIMLPLMITSFKAVRKKMKPKSWKKLQRSAYVFYGLIYVHTMLLYVPMVQAGRSVYIVNVIVYSLIFISYAGMRIRKELLKKKRGARCILPVAAVVCVAACVLGCIPWSALSPTEEPAVPAASVANADGDSDGKAYAASEVHYADGTHIGTGEGYNGTITVAVRIADGQITGVTVVSTSDDGSYWQSATAIIDEVVEKQSVDVDSVSGATYSSKGLKEAISNALATAVIDG
ncbi:MAG: FMN-binding protein, partial [Candidatus Fimadaptatus sp.]|nr:FMN-binding protein [Candidatus Fimadaptatus sp.]